MIWIVGAGICRGHLTERARKLIERADVVYGSRRAIELAEVAKARVLERFDDGTLRKVVEEGRHRDVVVLSTGDPMVAGLGRKLKGAGVVEPGISSVQVALSRLGVDLTDVVVIDAHARAVDSRELEMLNYRHLLILADRKFDLRCLGRRKVVLLENLCMDGERMIEGYSDELEVKSDYTIVFVERG